MTIQPLHPHHPAPAREEPLTILIVEDDPAIGDLLGEVVEEVPGWRAAVARNAQEAIALLRRVAPAVFLFDVNLPGPSGPELLAWLKGEPAGAGVPAVLMSAAGRGPQVRSALRRGQAMAFVQKPFDLDELLAVLHRAVQSVSVPVPGVQRQVAPATPPLDAPGERRAA
jgi:two-component system OmpR family response regulator